MSLLLTLKQYYSRTKNAHSKLTSSTRSGLEARKEMYRLTKLQKYTNRNFEKRLGRGKTYTTREVRKDLSRMEKKKTYVLKTRHRRLKRQGKTKLTQKEFIRANAHETSIDFESQQILYDSP